MSDRIPSQPPAGSDAGRLPFPACEWESHHHAIPPEAFDVAMRRRVLAVAWALRPIRIRAVPVAAGMLLHHLLTPAVARKLPDPERTRPGTFGLCGIVGDTSVETMMEALRIGLYPMGHVDPMKWWSPEERCVLTLADLKITRTLARLLRNGRFRVTFDQEPVSVLAGCAAPREGRPRLTWITPTMMRTALDLFDAGCMHSVEVWNGQGVLAGGLYGYAVGRVFIHESSFQTENHASSIGLATLAGHLAEWGYAVINSKRMTDRNRSLGYCEMPRRELRQLLQQVNAMPAGRWQVDPSLDIGHWNPAQGAPARREPAADHDKAHPGATRAAAE